MNKYVIAIYVRLSLEDVKYDSLSIENQMLLIHRHIDSLELADADVEILEFVDNGYSGTNFERPAVQELLTLVQTNRINCVIVKDFSRFGRNIIETGYFLEMVFPLFRTRFISVSDGFDSNDYKEDTGGMEVAFKFLMHEYYSQDLSRKTKSAKYAKMKRGEYISEHCVYGYRKGANGRLEIDEDTAPVVKMIFELARTMKSTTEIIKALHEKGIVPPGEYHKARGKNYHNVSRSIGIWLNSTILRILANEQYTGTYIMGKRAVTEVGGHRVRLKPENEWFKIPDHHPAIVSRELYEQVNSRLRHFQCVKTPHEYTLRMKVFCGCCRHAMRRIPRKERVFACKYTQVDENAECRRLEIGERELESLLYEIINKQAQAILDIDGLGEISGLSVKAEQQTEYERLMNKRREEKRRLYEMFILGELDADAYKAQKAVHDSELSQLSRSLNVLKAESAAKTAAKAFSDEMRSLADAALGTDKLNRQLVELLIEKVYVFPGNRIEIEWKSAGFAENVKEGAKNV